MKDKSDFHKKRIKQHEARLKNLYKGESRLIDKMMLAIAIVLALVFVALTIDGVWHSICI